MATSAFSLNDPVHVSRESRQLEGVISFIGSVSFAEGDDWIGVRLTGASVGMGKNDGSVQGVSYFECPPNCGVFVKESAVTKRELTRLEELRLRRELAGASKAPASTASSISPARSSASRSAATASSTTSEISTASDARSRLDEIRQRQARESTSANDTSPVKTSTMSKLEELRQRRAALNASKDQASTESLTVTPAVTVVPRNPVVVETSGSEVTELKTKVEELSAKLTKKEKEAHELADKLSSADKSATQAKSKVIELQTLLHNATNIGADESESPSVTEEVQEQLMQLQSEKDELRDQASEALREVTNLRRELEREKESHGQHLDELTKVRSEASALQNEVTALSDQGAQRGASDASHYKERAKLQAEVAAVKRKVEQLEKEKIELESSLEDVTLDKEQYLEEKEALEDRLEELRIDTETAQMEAEELRIELEDARMSAERMTSLADTGEGGEAEDKVQALGVQNVRLREALIRLREQSSVEKVDLTRQLRAAEKIAEDARGVMTEVEVLRNLKAKHLEEINDLKDMVEQGAAFEGMVEDLSDRLLSLEEDYISLQNSFREMEEAAELTAEMEEVQADEMKALSRDLEERDTIIRNLEEAIKMQRRREGDFKRTVGNYRTTVEILKQEKQALLELQQGGEGEKSSLLAVSQNALTRAAQLVSDAAEMRKREAQAVVDHIDCQLYRHLSSRLEGILPPTAAGTEVSSMKGELLVAKVLDKASNALAAIAKSFSATIRPLLPESDQSAVNEEALVISDELKQHLATSMNQADFAKVIISTSSELFRLLSAGQWPEVLTPEESRELGSVLGHSMADLDGALGSVLKTLKEEGVLSPEQSDVDALRQIIQTSLQAMTNDLQRENGPLVRGDWSPPAWKLMSEASDAKFSCMGVASAVGVLINPDASRTAPSLVKSLYNKVEQSCSLGIHICQRLGTIDERNEALVARLSSLVASWKKQADALLNVVKQTVSAAADWGACDAAAELLLVETSKVAALVRAENLQVKADGAFHPLSPEADDSWLQLAQSARSARAVDGDPEDVNYLTRARLLEQRLSVAVDNEPKLLLANSKVAGLEKSLGIRSKEIAMQNARLSELERLLAKTSSSPMVSKVRSSAQKSSEEINTVKEENRVLLEAMDVLQQQVDDYENEIKSLKDFKSPMRGSSSRTPRRNGHGQVSTPLGRNMDDGASGSGALEATLFRPALQRALKEAADWRAACVFSSIANLPPLSNEYTARRSEESKSDEEDSLDGLLQVEAALADLRIEKASIRLVDLTNKQRSPREQLRVMKAKCTQANERLETALLRLNK